MQNGPSLLSDEELICYNRDGMIPGPGETEGAFLQRVSVMQALAGERQIPPAHLEWTRLHVQELYGAVPRYLPVFYSNKSLPFWQGGVSWVEGGVVSIQLRKGFAKGSCLGYSREELLSHEAVHALRGAFEEMRFEEVFAYLTSEKRWRRVLGPMIQSPWEVWPFLLALVLGLFFPLGTWIAIAWLGAGFVRLARVHWTLRRAASHLNEVLGDVKKTRALLFRLTDREIALFAKKGEDLLAYAAKQTELRWRLLRLVCGLSNS
ncbi:MAG: ABC transporter ATP-binding protein [Verrucomicrobiota bacterium]|nr:ABC transporter ATP-binding protein [Verrucomicrobiota bacterium]